MAGGVVEELGRDHLHIALLGPMQDGFEGWNFGDEVSLKFALPAIATLLAVEMESRMGRHLVLEDSS